jgi:ADP-ribosylation factor GTPase-activating protein 1
VENENGGGRYREAPLDESKKDFWDSFAEAGAGAGSKPSAIGTSAVKKGNGGAGAGGKKDDDWDKW